MNRDYEKTVWSILPSLVELNGKALKRIIEEAKNKNDRNANNTLKKQYSARIIKKPLNVSSKLTNDVQITKHKRTFESHQELLKNNLPTTTSLISLQKKVINILSERQKPEFTAKTFQSTKNDISSLESIDNTKNSERLNNPINNLNKKLLKCNTMGKSLKNEVKNIKRSLCDLIAPGIKVKLKETFNEYNRQVQVLKKKIEQKNEQESLNSKNNIKELQEKLKDEMEKRRKVESDKKKLETSLQLLKEQYSEVKKKLNEQCKAEINDGSKYRDTLKELNEWKTKYTGNHCIKSNRNEN